MNQGSPSHLNPCPAITPPEAEAQRMQKGRQQKPFLQRRFIMSRALPSFFKLEVRAMERRLRVIELGLRLAALGLGVAASALVASDTQSRMFFAVEKRAKFTDMKVLVFLVAANAAAAGYNLLQIMRCLLGMMNGSFVFNKGLALAIFLCDQIMAYVALAAVAAAAQSGMIGQFGQPELQWMKVCNLYRNFCTQVGAGLGGAFIACLAMIIVSCISAFNLFRLYGSKKGNGSW